MKNNPGGAHRRNRIFSLTIHIIFSLLFIIIAQTFPMYSSTSIALAGTGPSIYFVEDFWDFGEITPDEFPTHIFKFKNMGDEILIIKDARVNCESCIDPVISTKELNPAEAGELKITVNSLKMIGRFTKRVYMESNDPINPQTIITVSGFIKNIQQTPYATGKYYFDRGEYDKAIIKFENSIELDTNHTESYFYLGQCYLQKGIIEYNNKNIFKAYSLYREANKLSEQVIPKYEKIIEDNPEDLNSYLRLGYIYETRSIVPFINENDKALKYYLKALDLITNSSSIGNTGIIIYLYTRIGHIYFEKKKYPQVFEFFQVR